MLSQIKLVFWKTYILRKRHWFLTISECVIPILLFLLVAYGRSKINGFNKIQIDNPTYNDVISSDLLLTQYVPHSNLKIYYAPKNNFTKSLIEKVQLEFGLLNDVFYGFNSEQALIDQYKNDNNENKDQELSVSIIFKGNDVKKLDYELGLQGVYISWDNDRLYSSYFNYEPGMGSKKYIYSGFIALQVAINMAFIQLHKNSTLPVDFQMLEFPYPPYKSDTGLTEVLLHYLPLITIFSYMFLCPALLKRVSEEKYSGFKELMKMMGMKSSIIWFGWIIHALIVHFISIIIITFLMKIPLWGAIYPPIEYINFSIFSVFLLLYGLACIAFCFFITAIFNKPTIALICGVLSWILTYFIPNALMTQYPNISWTQKMFLGIFPNVALNYGYNAMSIYEMREIGINWKNLFISGTGSNNDITMGNVFIIFIVDSIIFMVLTLYLENINPGPYGISKSIFYPITDSFRYIKRKFLSDNNVEDETLALNNMENGIGQRIGIQVNKLCKKFGSVMAVDDLSMNIYKNHITVLLGHNGAGKTTTMSIITGMIPATSGKISINGIDSTKEVNNIRQLIGLCPQHNLLLPDFTVYEHLIFFAKMKGRINPEKDVIELIKILKLNDKINELPDNLSGGMKRKLCLGMAIIGNCKVLILDEPTSGMDPESRREIWDLLLKWRKNTTILITTHFMEEADVLGDYIAIMANGRLQCYGTPIDLKNKFATGYHLSLVLDSTERENIQNIEIIMKNYIEDFHLIRQNGTNLVYLLPIESKDKFSEMFKALEAKENQLHLKNMFVSFTTLEEVFLKAKSEIDQFKEATSVNMKACLDDIITDVKSKTHQFKIESVFKGLFLKRFYYLLSKFFYYLPAIVLSMLLISLTIYLGENSQHPTYTDTSEKDINLKIYGKTTVLFSGNNENLLRTYEKLVVQQNGIPKQVQDVSNEIIQQGIDNIAFYKQYLVVAVDFKQEYNNNRTTITAMYSNNANHGAPISVNLVWNTLAKVYLNDEYSIKTKNKIIPLLNNNDNMPLEELSELQVAILWFILVPIGLLFLMGNFIIFPHEEISTNFNKLQMMCGIKPFFYWIVNLIFDISFYMLIILIELIIIILIFSLKSNDNLFGNNEFLPLITIFLVYGLTSIPFNYLFSYKKTLSSGFAIVLMVGMCLGVIPNIIVMALEESQTESYENIAKIFKIILFLICPQFSLGYILVKFSRKVVKNHNWLVMSNEKRLLICLDNNKLLNPCCKSSNNLKCEQFQNYYTGELGIQNYLLLMLISGVLYFTLIIFINSYSFKLLINIFSRNYKTDKDSNSGNGPKSDRSNLWIKHLKKCFKNKVVVNIKDFDVRKGECYGLLGVNGAGKTTTFRMLTRDEVSTYGKAEMINDDNISLSFTNDEYLKNIGYCPQYDALNLTLTGKQLLETFAYLRGYPHNDAKRVALNFIQIFELNEYADKPCGSYSGGNKRKLSTALAFMGFPKMILLDEPTNGVDPSSRRQFWNILQNLKKSQDVSFLLSSHSMEECEVLCDRIAIMKNGEIKAKGTLSELQNRIEKGFSVTFKLKSINNLDLVDCSTDNINKKDQKSIDISDQPIIKKIKNDINVEFKSAELKDEHEGLLHYYIKDPMKRWSAMFQILEALKNEYDSVIEDYSISATSLEDIFLWEAKH